MTRKKNKPIGVVAEETTPALFARWGEICQSDLVAEMKAIAFELNRRGFAVAVLHYPKAGI